MFDEDDEDDIITCPACSAEQPSAAALLGSLGRLSHYRCRYCGWQWHEDDDGD